MATITTRSIIDKARVILQDAAGIRWPDAEMLNYLNDGQREFVLLKPNAYVITTLLKLVEGTKQSLPSDGVQLVNVIRNMGASGSVPGRPVRITEQNLMDVQQPDWHQQTANAQAKHYMYSPFNPKTFYVYPPQPSVNQGYVEIAYGALPTNAVIGGTITLDDIYQTPLIDYILYRAYSKDSEFSADQNVSAKYQQSYMASLTGKYQAEISSNPNTSSTT